jgi:hypothetical protein
MEQLIQITSAGSGQHCDVYPHLSIHKVVLTNNYWKLIDRLDFIPSEFKVAIIEDLPMIQCNKCKNNFPEDTALLEGKCIRCFEREYIPATYRDKYRDILIDQISKSITNK